MSLKTEKVYTVVMKRRSVVRVLKSALHDASREVGKDRVVGIFGVTVHEDGTVNLLSAVTYPEMQLVMKAIPEALNVVALKMVKPDDVAGN